MKKNPWLIGGVILLTLVAVFAASLKFIAPAFLKKKILEGVKDSCSDCVLSFRSVDISLAHPGLLTLDDLRFAAGEGGRSLVEVRMSSLAVDVSLSQTLREKLVLRSVEGFGVEVIYADGDAPKIKESEKKPETEHATKVAILSAKMEGALFRYVHSKNKHTSILHIHDIEGELNAVGTTPELRDVMATARLTGQIEKSGHGELVLAALLRPGPAYVDALLSIKNQNLGDLNTFFTPNDGIFLGGNMVKMVANVNVRNDNAKSHVEATYKDAEFKERATQDASALEAWLSNIGSSLVMTKTNVDRRPIDRMAEIEVKRDVDEPLVHYILRSMKLCLLDVVKKSDSRQKSSKMTETTKR